MDSRWLSHLKSREEKDKFKQYLYANQDILNALKRILKDDLNTTIRSRRSLKSYATQNWAAYQADRIATERTLQSVITLLNLDIDGDNEDG